MLRHLIRGSPAGGNPCSFGSNRDKIQQDAMKADMLHAKVLVCLFHLRLPIGAQAQGCVATPDRVLPEMGQSCRLARETAAEPRAHDNIVCLVWLGTPTLVRRFRGGRPAGQIGHVVRTAIFRCRTSFWTTDHWSPVTVSHWAPRNGSGLESFMPPNNCIRRLPAGRLGNYAPGGGPDRKIPGVRLSRQHGRQTAA